MSLLALENEARASLASVAATETTSAYAAGYSSVASPSLPAAATTTEPPVPPPAHAYWRALCSVVESPPPSDIEMTFAPRSCTQVMQLATSAVEPWPSGPPSALQTASGELKATPATPRPLLVFAVIVPEVCVPWPLSSAHEPLLIEPESTGRTPCDVAQSATLPTRSSCVFRIPVSTMPTFTPPVFGNAPRPARSQPADALIFASPYSSPKRGSFGTALIRMVLL